MGETERDSLILLALFTPFLIFMFGANLINRRWREIGRDIVGMLGCAAWVVVIAAVLVAVINCLERKP